MLRCPNCGSESGFLIESRVVMAFNCAEQCVGNYDKPRYDSYDMCTCVDCDYEDIVGGFRVGDGDETNHE